MRWFLPVLLLACEQPAPAPLPQRPVGPVSAVAPPDPGPSRVERTPDPPKKLENTWVFETPGQLLDTYLKGTELGRVRVSGAVGAIVEVGATAGTRYLLGPAGGRFVELRFRDGGTEAARKRVGHGSLITAECTADARIGQNAQLVDCVLL